MRLSRLVSRTVKTIPSDETAKNAQLLIKAGYITKSMAGAYSFLPLGYRVLRNIENIIRKHMNNVGGQEVLMNNLQPKEWWERAGSWDHEVNDALFHLSSLNLPGVEYALSSSNEENVSTVVSQFIASYKDLPIYTKDSNQWPLSLYHIHTKFRDEMRSKAGLMRGREFRMKDMYDFHQTKESQEAYFEVVTQAYLQCFQELGLDAKVVNASGGSFSDKFSREFQVFCDAGEDRLYTVPETDYLYNEEIAPAQITIHSTTETNLLPIEEHYAKGVIGVEAVHKALGLTVEQCTKTVLYIDSANNLVVAVVRADREVSEEKLRSLHKSKLRLATNEEVLQWTGAEVGYAGLYQLPHHETTKIYVDDSCAHLVNWECGGNKDGLHVTNVNWERDVPKPSQFYDIKVAKEGDIHPVTQQHYVVHKGVEIGNIFDLGKRYTKALDVRYTDQNNVQQTPYMGCHGIGTTRIMGVITEIYNDEKGLKWPRSVAPFRYHLVSYAGKNDDSEVIQKIATLSQQFYDAFTDQVLWDDRGVGMGEKLSDAELIGCPVCIIISSRNVQKGIAEAKNRDTGEVLTIPLDQLLNINL